MLRMHCNDSQPLRCAIDPLCIREREPKVEKGWLFHTLIIATIESIESMEHLKSTCTEGAAFLSLRFTRAYASRTEYAASSFPPDCEGLERRKRHGNCEHKADQEEEQSRKCFLRFGEYRDSLFEKRIVTVPSKEHFGSFRLHSLSKVDWCCLKR